MSRDLEEAFAWNRQIEGKQIARFPSPPKSNGKKRQSRILLPNFMNLANIMLKEHANNANALSKQVMSKKISALLLFTEKANGVKSERKRESKVKKSIERVFTK